MDPMVGATIPYMDYSASIAGDGEILLVGKSTRLLRPILGGSTSSVSLTVGVGQMKLEAPPRCSVKHQPRVHVWLTQIERYMKLM